MRRKTRMYLPDIPVHVVQRGNNRDACFSAKTSTVTFWIAFAKGKVDSA